MSGQPESVAAAVDEMRVMAELNHATIAEIIAHMNDDHAESIAAYARHFGGVADVRTASITAMDATGMTVAASLASDERTIRIPFDHVLLDADDARQTLIAMARTSM